MFLACSCPQLQLTGWRPAALPRCRLPCSSPQLKWWRLHSDALPRCRAPRLPCSWLLPLPSSHPPTFPPSYLPTLVSTLLSLPVSSQAAFPGKPGKSPENEYSSAFPTLISETAWKLPGRGHRAGWGAVIRSYCLNEFKSHCSEFLWKLIIRSAKTRDFCATRFFCEQSHFHGIDYFWKHETSNSRLRHSI